MAIYDFGTVRLFSDGEGVDVYFPRHDTATRDRVKELKGNFNGEAKRWRVFSRYCRKSPEEIVASLREALEAAAPEWWSRSLPSLAPHACVSRKYGLKIGIGGMRLDLPPGHPLDYTFEKEVQGATRDGRSWLVPPDAIRTAPVKKAIERVLREDKKIFADAARFIGPRRIAGSLAVTPEEIAALGLQAGGLVAVDRSFLAKADPEMPTSELAEWCLLVEQAAPVGDALAVVLRYADLGPAFGLLRARRADPMPPPALGGHHAVAKFERQKSG